MEEHNQSLAAALGGDERGAIGKRRPGSIGELRVGLGQHLAGDGDVGRDRHAVEWALARESGELLRLFPAQAAAERAAAAAQLHRHELVIGAGEVRPGKAHKHAAIVDPFVELICLADRAPRSTCHQLNKWIDNGGVLVRFAGPHLAGADDKLVPVKLRRGGRTLGGSLSWDKPQQLAAFSREGPFNGMPVPTDVTVTRQVLAEPDSQLTDRTWATLADGTPLVTAERRGKGLIVLFHVTADTRWSDLPLSGAFVDMLRRLVTLAGSSAAAEASNAANEAAAAVRHRLCLRPACSMALAHSRPRHRRHAPFPAITPNAAASIIHPVSMGHRKDWSR